MDTINKKLRFSKTAIHQAIVRFRNFGSFQDLYWSGRPRITSQKDDHLMKRMVVRSPKSSTKEMRSALLVKGTVVSKTTIKHHLTNEFELKTYKSAKKPRLNPFIKAIRYAFANAHLDCTTKNLKKVLFFDESTVQQFTSRKQLKRRPVGAKYENHYIIQTMKHLPSIMVWETMSAHGKAGLYFLQPGTTMNDAKYLDLLKDKLEIHTMVYDCNVFMNDGAPCHRTKSVKNFLQEKIADILNWSVNSPDLNPIKNLWHVMKNEVTVQHPTSMESFKIAIKSIWTQKMTLEYCCNLINSMSCRMAAVVKDRGGLIKYYNNKVNDVFLHLWCIINYQ